MDTKSNELIKEIDVFWGRLFEYNLSLLKKSGEEKDFGKESFEEVINLYLTSQALETIKGIITNPLGSLGTLLAARCFLEGLAIKRMYKRGKISPTQVELLKRQVFIIEYNYYKDFQDIAESALLPEKLKENYDHAVAFFKEKLSSTHTEKQIKEIIKSDVPFLCDPYSNYRKLIEEHLGEEFAKLYGLYSQAIHPSTNDFYKEGDIWQTLTIVFKEILVEYGELEAADVTFSSYNASIYSGGIAQRLEKIIQKENKVLAGIGAVFERFFENSYITNTLKSLELLNSDICSDVLLGLREGAKAKWKIILDMFASFRFCYIQSFPDEKRYKLLKEHKAIQFERNKKEDFSLEKAYAIYKEIYPMGVSEEEFRKGFLSTTGYTIDSTGKNLSLTQLVKNLLKVFPKAEDPGQSLDRHLMLNYVESQMISHANGYLWYANTGSCNDIYNTIMGADSCLLYILEVVLFVFQTHRSIETTKKYKQIINVIRNGMRKIKELIPDKSAILKMPCVFL